VRGTLLQILERSDNAPLHPHFGNFDRPRDTRQAYFEALEQLRDHLSRCLAQIATIAGMQTPTDGLIANLSRALVSRGVSSATPLSDDPLRSQKPTSNNSGRASCSATVSKPSTHSMSEKAMRRYNPPGPALSLKRKG
jgi:hypothetical protein